MSIYMYIYLSMAATVGLIYALSIIAFAIGNDPMMPKTAKFAKDNLIRGGRYLPGFLLGWLASTVLFPVIIFDFVYETIKKRRMFDK